MKRRMIKLYPNISLEALEKKLKFKFLPQIAFESESERLEVLARGKNEKISAKAMKWGQKFKDQIDSSYLPSASVRWINRHIGYGLFAEEEIFENSYVGEYTGIVRKNNRHYFEPLNNYCYEYPVPDSIGRSYVTDATSGHLTRFINHSGSPNLKPHHVFLDGYYHLIFLSIRKIAVGEQFSFDYGARYWYLRTPPAEI